MSHRPGSAVYALAVEPLSEEAIVLALAGSGRASEVLRTHRVGKGERCGDSACGRRWPCLTSVRAQGDMLPLHASVALGLVALGVLLLRGRRRLAAEHGSGRAANADELAAFR